MKHCIYNEPGLSKERLRELVDLKLITERKHPAKELWIYCYSKQCVLEQAWEPWTLVARGLVLDREGMVVARSFPKFFNHTDPQAKHVVKSGKLPDHVMEKMDGSLGILFFTGDWTTGEITTKGSFESPQALVGNCLYQALPDETKKNLYEDSTFNTVLFEIICQESRMVVNYGGEEYLALLGWVNKSGSEMWPAYGEGFNEGYEGIRQIKSYSPKNLIDLEMLQRDNAEGYVCWFNMAWDDEIPQFELVKVKFEDYKLKHQMVSQYSPEIVLQELIRDWDWEEDPELPNHAVAQRDRLAIQGDVQKHLDLVHGFVFEFVYSGKPHAGDKKIFANQVNRELKSPEHKSMAFLMFDNWECGGPASARRYALEKVISRRIKFGKYLGWE